MAGRCSEIVDEAPLAASKRYQPCPCPDCKKSGKYQQRQTIRNHLHKYTRTTETFPRISDWLDSVSDFLISDARALSDDRLDAGATYLQDASDLLKRRLNSERLDGSTDMYHPLASTSSDDDFFDLPGTPPRSSSPRLEFPSSDEDEPPLRQRGASPAGDAYRRDISRSPFHVSDAPGEPSDDEDLDEIVVELADDPLFRSNDSELYEQQNDDDSDTNDEILPPAFDEHPAI